MNKSNERAQEIFDHVIDLPEHQRPVYLDGACGSDAALREHLEMMLEVEARRAGFMEDPTVEPPEEEGASSIIRTMIGPYKLLQEIGTGGHGVVYLAEQRQPIDRKVALKIIKLGMDTRQVIARFEAERQALAMMDHPNIARVLDAGATERGRPYFVMELVRGVRITEYCDECQLSTKQRLDLFSDVCRAVQHAHQKGVIHRDLKPSNILVTLHDGVPVPKVIDFGIAKATNFRLTEKTLFTDFHQFVGTPAYSSPEQMEMSGLDVDVRSDIYSLGVLLYELLTGTTPIARESLEKEAYGEIQRLVVEVEPPRPSTRVSSLGNERQLQVAAARSESPNKLHQMLRGDLDWIIMKALEKDRERRYDSAQGFLKDVQRHLHDEPVKAAAPSLMYRMRKFAMRHQVAAAIGAVLLLASMVSVWQAVRATRAASSERVAKVDAQEQTVRAEAKELESRRNLYFTEMNIAQSALDEGAVERAILILENHFPREGEEDVRDFEWRYLWGQAHRETFLLTADDDPNDDIKPDPIFRLALSPKRDLLASAARNGRIRVWDLAMLKERFRFDVGGHPLTWVDFSPDGRFLLAGGRGKLGNDERGLVVWDVLGQHEVSRFTPTDAKLTDPKFLPDGTVAMGASDGSVWFWNPETDARHSVRAHEKQIGKLSVVGNRLITSGSDLQVNVWDADEKRILRSFQNTETPESTPGYQLENVAFSPDMKWFASPGFPGPRVRIHQGEAGPEPIEFILSFPTVDVSFSPDGSSLASAEMTGIVRLFDVGRWEERTRYFHRGHQMNAIAWSSDSELLASGGDNGIIMGWPGKPSDRGLLRSNGMLVTSVQYSPDGRFLATGMNDGRLELWETRSERRVLETAPRGNRGMLPPEFDDDFFAFSADSQHLAIAQSGAGNPTVDVWQLESLEKVQSIAHDQQVNTLAYSPDGRLMATGARDGGGVRIWDIEKQEVIQQMPVGGWVMCLAFSPDSKLLAGEGYHNYGIRVWDVETGEEVAVLKDHIEPVGDNQSVLFSPDGKILATAGYDCKVILWDTTTWERVRTLLGHSFLLIDLSFSPDGKRLASSAVDGRCRVWDVATGQEVANFIGYAVDFSPDGNSLAIGGGVNYRMDKLLPESSTIRIHRAPTLGEIDRGKIR